MRLGRPVALKISRSLFDTRFEPEARAISSLNHPHICTLHDIGPDYMVMELVDGETLALRLLKGALPIREVLRYGAQISGALAAAHDKNITHRDLKPANIMISRNGDESPGFRSGQMLQSRHHLYLGRRCYGNTRVHGTGTKAGKDADTRTDIYALGYVLYEMATGKSVTPDQALPMKGLPETFTHIVERCLKPEQEDRWQSEERLLGGNMTFGSPPSIQAKNRGALAKRAMSPSIRRAICFRSATVF